MSKRELADAESGRCIVLMNDGETWGGVYGCRVTFYDADERWELNPECRPSGYRTVRLDEIILHYLKTGGGK
jgi:hypothetical protein